MKRLYPSPVYIIAAFVLSPCAAEAQVLPNVTGPLNDLAGDTLREQRLQEIAERRARRLEEEAAEAVTDTTGAVDDAVEPVAGSVADAAADATGAVTGTLRKFTSAAAPDGSQIEADVLVALLDADDVETLRAAGYDILAEREMQNLGRVMVTLEVPAGIDLDGELGRLRGALADASLDYNHLYRWDDAKAEAAEAPAAEEVEAVTPDDSRLRIGVIDSAVQADHRALRDVQVKARDFVAHDAKRPETHGTAVASLIARSAGNDVVVYSASVFFELEGYAPGASTEGLVAALDWLAGEQVDVINMSLSGPGNDLLGAAIEAVLARGQTVVAAVGNEGPSSPPRYPAAYDGVIGVTAVDRKERVFRAANRGEHVDFAALGVDVKVADSTNGSYRLASGTSMASPHIAVVAARLLREGGVTRDALESWLIAGAEDLGRRGFDPVYGHGLVTRVPMVAASD